MNFDAIVRIWYSLIDLFLTPEEREERPAWNELSQDATAVLMQFVRACATLRGWDLQGAHQLWCRTWAAAGWKIGPKYDAVARTRPDIDPQALHQRVGHNQALTMLMIIFEQMRQTVGSPIGTLLMAPNNPSGWALHQLMAQLRAELTRETTAILGQGQVTELQLMHVRTNQRNDALLQMVEVNAYEDNDRVQMMMMAQQQRAQAEAQAQASSPVQSEPPAEPAALPAPVPTESADPPAA